MHLGHLIAWVLFGFVIGLLGRLFMPGRDPMGFLATTLLGIIGSVVGGMIAYALHFGTSEYSPGGWIMSIIGAVIALVIYRQSQTGRRV